MLFKPNLGSNLLVKLSDNIVWGKNPESGVETSISIYNNSDKELILDIMEPIKRTKIIYPLTIFEFKRLDYDTDLYITANGKRHKFTRKDFKRKMNEFRGSNKLLDKEVYAKRLWSINVSNKSDVFYWENETVIWERKEDDQIPTDYALFVLAMFILFGLIILIILIIVYKKIPNDFKTI